MRLSKQRLVWILVCAACAIRTQREKDIFRNSIDLQPVEKIINDPILLLKRKADRKTRDIYLDMTKNLFNLDHENGDGA